MRLAAPVLLALLALGLVLPRPCRSAEDPKGMALDLFNSVSKSPDKRRSEERSSSARTGPVAPTAPRVPATPGAAPAGAAGASRPFLPLQGGQPRPAAQPRQQLVTVNLDGVERRAILTLPRLAPPRKGQAAPRPPLLVFLHGAGGSAGQAMRQTNLAERAAAAGYLVAFPEGLGPPNGNGDGQTWNAWMCCGYARDQRVDDVGFLSALISRLKTDYGADPRRVYLAGFSNGAMLASRFVLERPGVAAALASVAGYLPCDAERPTAQLPVLILHGSQDGVARFAPTPAHPATGRFCEDYPARAQADFWVRGFGLPAKGQVRDAKKSPARVEEYGPAKKGGRGFVRFVIVKGGGHAWPGGARERFRYCDLPVSGVDATGVVLEFFRQAQAPQALAPGESKGGEAAKARPAKKRRPAG